MVPAGPTRLPAASRTVGPVTAAPTTTLPAALVGTTFDAVLFDMDGTLVDSTPAVTRSWLRWAREEGVDPALLVARHGVPAAGIVEAVMPERGPAARAAALERIEAIEVADTDGVVVLPGVLAALAALAGGARSAVVTSSTRPLALARIAAAGLVAPDVVVTASDVTRGKPDPQPFLLAAQRLGADPARCLVVEDAPAGLVSGRAAGCTTLALATTHTREELAACRPDAVVDDLGAVTLVVGTDGVRLVPADPTAG